MCEDSVMILGVSHCVEKRMSIVFHYMMGTNITSYVLYTRLYYMILDSRYSVPIGG